MKVIAYLISDIVFGLIFLRLAYVWFGYHVTYWPVWLACLIATSWIIDRVIFHQRGAK